MIRHMPASRYSHHQFLYNSCSCLTYGCHVLLLAGSCQLPHPNPLQTQHYSTARQRMTRAGLQPRQQCRGPNSSDSNAESNHAAPTEMPRAAPGVCPVSHRLLYLMPLSTATGECYQVAPTLCCAMSSLHHQHCHIHGEDVLLHMARVRSRALLVPHCSRCAC